MPNVGRLGRLAAGQRAGSFKVSNERKLVFEALFAGVRTWVGRRNKLLCIRLVNEPSKWAPSKMGLFIGSESADLSDIIKSIQKQGACSVIWMSCVNNMCLDSRSHRFFIAEASSNQCYNVKWSSTSGWVYIYILGWHIRVTWHLRGRGFTLEPSRR